MSVRTGSGSTRRKSGSEPVCWFCKEPIPLDAPFRASISDLDLPAGVVICGLECRKLPLDALVWEKTR